VTDVITFTGHNNFTTAVMANKPFFDGLSDDDQALIRNGMKAAFDHIVEYQRGLGERSLENIKEQKPEIQVNRLTQAQRQPFRDAAQEVEAKFIEMTGERGQAILDQFKADLKAVQQ
jgi:TRAP-type C4-dicarboxylate transport system substrate-binding protein